MSETQVEKPQRKRSDIFQGMEVGEQVTFQASDHVKYASIRGAAYAYGKRHGRVYKAKRINETTISISRES